MSQTSTSLTGGALLGAALLQSCATLISGTSQTIRLVGQPAGSTVYINDQQVPTTPVPGTPNAVSIRVPRKRSAEIKVKHDGYKEYSEVLYPNKFNFVTTLNYAAVLATTPFWFTSSEEKFMNTTIETSEPNLGPMVAGGSMLIVGPLVDLLSGATKKFEKSELHPMLVRRPAAVAGSQTVQSGPVLVRIKGGEKMGNLFINNEVSEALYFGKSLNVDADNLRKNVNSALRELGYTVPAAEGRSVFAAGPSARFSLQAEMHDIHYDVRNTAHVVPSAGAYNGAIVASNYATTCNVSVTWKLVDQNRQPVAEAKTTGSSIRTGENGNAAFEDAFENALYAFMEQPAVVGALTTAAPASPVPAVAASAAAPAASSAAIAMRRAAPLKLVADNGVAAAAKCVVTVETADGHGSGCLISPDGYLITNAHVVNGAATVSVLLPEGIQTTGKVLRVNADMDLALVKIEVDNLSAFQLPTAGAAEVGADVFAIGTPADKELGQSVTKGIISGRRKIEGHTLLQTDVSINGGNSGGALVNRGGQLLGVVNAKLVGRGIEGIGFAIPAEQVADALQLKFVD